MGLDMYLTAKLSISKYDEKFLKQAEKVRKIFPEMYKSDNLDTVEVIFEVGYWRKANHIHRWFVENCQDGEDECQVGYVSRDKLKELLKLCKKVLKNKKKAKGLLPTQEGFFFGGEEYDKYYFIEIEETIRIIDKCLKLPEGWSFEYQSSW